MRLRLLITLLLLISGLASAQDVTCNTGDIAWVSSALNANVGLASGAGRCAANTVAGGNYNDPLVPFGIQGAIDCACAGSFIHVLGDGDYGSATASWNNRFDATKEIRMTNSRAPSVLIVGYADSATSCRDNNNPAGCPVDMDFAGGTGDGFQPDVSGWNIFGLGIHNATLYGVNAFDNVGASVYAGLELTGNGYYGIVLFTSSGGPTSLVRSTVTGNGGGAVGPFGNGGVLTAQNTQVLYTYIGNNTGTGLRDNNTAGVGRQQYLYNIIQGNTGDGIEVNGNENYYQNNTVRDNGAHGVDVVAAGSANAMLASFVSNIFADNGGWGINSARHPTRTAGLLAYNFFSGNASGAINTALMPAGSFPLEIGNNLAATITFVSATDSNVDGDGALIETEYPSGNTPLVMNAGAIPDAVGGSGSGSGPYVPVGAR